MLSFSVVSSGSIDMKRTKAVARTAAPDKAVSIFSPDDRAAAGKALRGQIRITDQPPLIFHPEETRAA
jgi:hypothetical protein